MKLHFNFKDLFRAPRLAFSFQRIWINALGLAVGYAIYLIFTYVSLLASGYSFTTIWSQQGLLACGFSFAQPWYGRLIAGIGSLLFLIVVLITNTAVSRAVYMVLRDEFFYTWSQAFKFAIRKWASVLGAYLTFAFMIAFFIIGALIMGLIGRIPYVGEWLNFLLTIPYFFAAVLLAFIVVVTGVGLFLVPAIIATSDEDAMGGVFQSFSMTYNQPWRLGIYGAIVAVLEAVSLVVFAAVVKIGYKVFAFLFTIGMGEKFVKVKETGLAWLNHSVPVLRSWVDALLGPLAKYVYLTQPHAIMADNWSLQVAAFLFTVFLILIGGVVIAYGEAVGNAGLTLLYVDLYKIQEDENLLEREDEELKEEEEEEEKEKEETKEEAPAEASSEEEKGKESSSEEESEKKE